MASASYASNPGSQYDLMDLQVLHMNGEALQLRVSSIRGREVQRMVLEERPSNQGQSLLYTMAMPS